MAYGSPSDEASVEPYLRHIRGGRRPSSAAVEELTGRYRAIGGSPLATITHAQAAALSALSGLPTFVGFKHAPPFVADGAREAADLGITRLVGLPLAPHYARLSLGGYARALAEVWNSELLFVPGFHDHPAFIEAVVSLLREAFAQSQPERLFFSAHSLPERIVAEGDAYADRLLESCRLVAGRLKLPPWEFAFQSASATGEPWLGPDLLQAVARSGAGRVLVCPIGFVADHLEILYDLDLEAQRFASARGIEIRRTASFNDRPEFIRALAAVSADALARRPGHQPPQPDEAVARATGSSGTRHSASAYEQLADAD